MNKFNYDDYQKVRNRFNPDKYEKTKIKTKPQKIGQVFFISNGNRPAVINAKVIMADGFYPSGKPKTKTTWHYTYLKHSDWNMFKGGYYGKNISSKEIVEANYIGDIDDETT
jgi:hypothetical protein